MSSAPLMATYQRQPVAFTHGQGVRLFDAAGRSYLDCLAGIAVNTLGHAHPRLVAALREQVARVIHTSNLFEIPLQEDLARELVGISGLSNVFFCNSGLEANEAAIKLARLHGHRRGFERPEIVVYDKAFHGRSLATLSATGNAKVQKGFEPLVEGFVRLPPNALDRLRDAADAHPQISAVFLESIQGEGGINAFHPDYLQAVRRLCDERGWLLMIDEVQCGMGRTGRWFAHQWADIRPDVRPLAKGLGSGVPIGAVVAGPAAADLFQPGLHGTTFGGNPLAMRAALTTIAVMKDEGLLDNASRIGTYLRERFQSALAASGRLLEIRGRGLMIGLALDRPCGALVAAALAEGLIINVTADSVVRLLPPLIFRQDDADELVDKLTPLILNLPG